MATFTGKTVLITGASAGIGRALALALAAERAQLALNARNEARLAAAVRECAARGAEALALPADVSRQEDCAAMVAGAVAHFGRLDVLINNAGLTMWSRFDALSDLSVFNRLLATNYLGAVYATAAALPALKAARRPGWQAARHHSHAGVAPHERSGVCATDRGRDAAARSAADHFRTRATRPPGAPHRTGSRGPRRCARDPRAPLTAIRRRPRADRAQ
jgi:NAD(P)-dependent dehydrogenase (short-subunit alcohol dehydrogenase family)